MEHTRKLGPLAIALALMIFASSASANTWTAPKGSALTPGSLVTATSTNAQLTGSVTTSCKHSHLNTKVVDDGGIFDDMDGEVYALTFTECGTDTVNVLKKGTWETEDAGGGTGSLRLTGTEITVQIHRSVLGFPITTHCIYVTNDTNIGTIVNGSPTKLNVASQPLPEVATDGACGNDAVWDGTYSYTSPNPLYFDE